MILNLHAILPSSRANGPGLRTAIWFQGCSRRCPGCFNPETHPFEPRIRIAAAALIDRIRAGAPAIEGITISGGEPLEQDGGLLGLLAGLRGKTHLSVILFSGYRREEIEARPHGKNILGMVDVLVAGPFEQARLLGHGLRGSTNQEIHLLTPRYRREAIEATPEAEILISPAGSLTFSGVADVVEPVSKRRVTGPEALERSGCSIGLRNADGNCQGLQAFSFWLMAYSLRPKAGLLKCDPPPVYQVAAAAARPAQSLT